MGMEPEMTPREGLARGSLVYLYILAVTLFGVGLSIWLGLEFDIPGFIVLGIGVSQLVMIAGSCGIVLWRH
jgi:hypothetical protein